MKASTATRTAETIAARRPASGPLVQRKCACGMATASLAGDCDACRKKKDLGLQPKLRMAAPEDAFEREADEVAARVTGRSIPAGSPVLTDVPTLDATHRVVLSAGELTAGGMMLATPVQRFFERRFGRDFSSVRVHTGVKADLYNDHLSAHAFTYGNHIWLGRDHQPQPGFLLAHELAHVVQQKQPPTLKSREHTAAGLEVGSTPASGPVIQRWGLGLPFWAPIDETQGRLRTGTEIHRDVLRRIRSLNPGIDVEAAVPNAIRSAHGFDLQGSADMYLSEPKGVRVGIYFDKLKRPARHFRAGRQSRRSPYPRFSETAGITGIDRGPTTVWAGELKPADKEFIERGNEQLNHYGAGFEFARDRTNEWATARASTESWKFKSLQRISEAQVPNMPAPENVSLAVALVDELAEGPNQTAKYRLRKEFVPSLELGRQARIPGKFHVTYVRDGLFAYYARPDNLEQALDLPRFRRRRRQDYMRIAEAVREEVIGDLTQEPEAARTYARRRGRPDLSAAAGPPRIQRQPKGNKPAKAATTLVDHFNYNTWSMNRKTLARIVDKDLGDFELSRGKQNDVTALALKGGKKSLTFTTLRLLELAGKADKRLSDVPHTGRSSLDLSLLQETIPGKGLAGPGSLTGLFGWIHRWTSAPIDVLGRFRSAFGGVFVRVANAISGMARGGWIDKIKARLRALFEKLSSGKGGSPLAALALRGVTFAIKQVADILLPGTFRMVGHAIHEGVRKKVLAVFGLDIDSLIESTFQRFKGWVEKITGFSDAVKGIVNKVVEAVAAVEKIGDQVRKVVNYIEDAATVLKWGIRAAQCSGVLSCVTILLEPLKNWAIRKFGEKALSSCGVRYLLAKGVLGVFGGVAATMARGVMSLLRRLVPSGLDVVQEVLAEEIQEEPVPDATTITDTECWSIDLGFSLLAGFANPAVSDKDDDEEPGAQQPGGPAKPHRKTPSKPSGQKPKAPPVAKQPTPPPPPPAAPGQGSMSQGTAAPDLAAGERPWDTAALHIKFVEGRLEAGKTLVYEESLVTHTRLQQQRRDAAVCAVNEPDEGVFTGLAYFFVDYANVPRPGRFTPPAIGLNVKVNDADTLEQEDPAPSYQGSGTSLRSSKVPNRFGVKVREQDTVTLELTLSDTETNTPLTYRDQFRIKVTRCA